MPAPKDQPGVTDLRRYRRERERARRREAQGPRPGRPNEPMLGARPRAGLILLLVIAALTAFWLLPKLSTLMR